MKALTIYQPWASLLACGSKKFETRSWATSYRGPIAIHAAKKDPIPMYKYLPLATQTAMTYVILPMYMLWKNVPLGAIIATAKLVECWECIGPDVRGDPMILKGRDTPEWDSAYLGDDELLFGNFEKGRYAWEFANMTMLSEPIPARGGQRIWNWEGVGSDG